MTGSTDPLEGQLALLRRSLVALARLGDSSPTDPGLPQQLVQLADQVPQKWAGTFSTAGPHDALEVISQARASLGLLRSAGVLDGGDGGGLGVLIVQALDTLEGGVGRWLRESLGSQVYGLYVIIDPEVTSGRDPLEVARGALAGGARVLQLRDKLREKGQTLPLARGLKELCDRHGALLIINDHADLAAAVDAHGLHVGQGDLPVAEARGILKPGQIIGRSNHLVEEARESQAQGADHVAIGAVYPTTTKPSIVRRATIGPEAVARLKEAVDLPVVAIGGINEGNVEPVAAAGADAICVTSAVGLAPDPEMASRRLVEKILGAGGKA